MAFETWLRKDETTLGDPEDLSRRVAQVQSFQSEALCAKCLQNMSSLLMWPRGDYTLPYHQNYASFNRAALSGCSICKIVQSRLPKSAQSWSRTMRYCETSAIEVSSRQDSFHAVWHMSFGKHLLFALLMPQEALQLAIAHTRIPSYEAVDSSGSTECIDLVKRWIGICRTKHPDCKRLRSAPERDWSPTRLIYCNPNATHLQIHEGSDIPPSTSYLTLSHCWGQLMRRFQLTTETLPEWKRALPSFGDFKTFADAVAVAQACGIDYLWIDSLCILQDSEADWAHESSLMAKVYKFSYCNISATSATNDTEGLFFPRDPGLPPYAVFRVTPVLSVTEPLSASLGPISMELVKRESNVNLGHGPRTLFTRGWVVQEMIMSPRIVHFRSDQIHWTCDELEATESFPDRNWEHLYRSPQHNIDKRVNIFKEVEDPLITWVEVIRQYSRTSLTRPDDVLPAISAVAREIQLQIGGRYYAGLFERGILAQLCWKRQLGHSRMRPGNGFPSWSWISVLGLSEDSMGSEAWRGVSKGFNLARFIDCDVVLRDGDSFGRVKSAQLQLRGVLLPFTVCRLERECGEIIIDDQLKWDSFLDAPLSTEVTHSHIEVRVLPLLIEVDGSGYCRIKGIALRALDGAGRYQRVGFVYQRVRLGAWNRKNIECFVNNYVSVLGIPSWSKDRLGLLNFIPHEQFWETVYIS